jgi:pimeloyl-ACP methyl ester carboxylesterase
VSPTPEFTTFDTGEAEIAALRWAGRAGAPTVVAIHGITANAWSWDPVAHQLAGGPDVVAVDLRGRGRSWTQPGPVGLRQHADDVAAVIEQIGGPVIVAGHSMGTYVSLLLAERHPALVRSLVLVDGGTALYLPEPPLDDDGVPIPMTDHIDHVLDVSLGPAIERLEKVWPDRVSYQSMWAQHPAFVDGIGPDLERNLLADLVETDGGFRTMVDPDAVRLNGRELFADEEVRTALDRHPEPATMIRAEFGLMGTPPPLIADDMIDRYPQHRWIRADGLNHYTVMNSAAGATIVADAIRAALAVS